MTIERIKENEIMEASEMIERSIRFSDFARFYPACSLDYLAGILDYDGLKKKAEEAHVYVIKENARIIGCGAIGSYCGSTTESCISVVFIDPEYQGRSYGRKLIERLENDEYFHRAKRIEIAASISAIPFYRKMGYEHKDCSLIYDDGCIILEKFNS